MNTVGAPGNEGIGDQGGTATTTELARAILDALR